MLNHRIRDLLFYIIIRADILLIARNTMQLAKYLHVLYVKPSNKVYLFFRPLKYLWYNLHVSNEFVYLQVIK